MPVRRKREAASLYFSVSHCTTEMMALFPEAIPQHVNTYSMKLFINIPFPSHIQHSLTLQTCSNYSRDGSFVLFVFVSLSGKNHLWLLNLPTRHTERWTHQITRHESWVKARRCRWRVSATQLLPFSLYYLADWQLLRCCMYIWRSLVFQRTRFFFHTYWSWCWASRCGLINENRKKKK